MSEKDTEFRKPEAWFSSENSVGLFGGVVDVLVCTYLF